MRVEGLAVLRLMVVAAGGGWGGVRGGVGGQGGGTDRAASTLLTISPLVESSASTIGAVAPGASRARCPPTDRRCLRGEG